jgi:hypothetical protein
MSRSRLGVSTRMLVRLLPALATTFPALANWQDDLAAQLRWDHDCVVQFYSGVIEGELVVIAKAHCEDGRTFDAVQRNELEDFEIIECNPTEQTC